MPTFGLASALKQCVEAQGFEVAPGKLEIFPNTKAYGFGGEFVEYNAHRLPLQPASGSVLLDADGNPTSSDLGRFFVAWDWAATGQSLEEVRAAIAIARSNGNKRRRRRLTIVEDWRQDLQTEINEGWTGYGQTNALLKTIACYGVVFEHLTGEALAEFVQGTAENAPGYTEFCRHQHEISRRSTVWAKAAEKYYWALGTEPKREGSFLDRPDDNKVIPINRNVQRAEDAQKRIRAAMEQMTTEGQLPAEATPRKEALERQGISSRTLYKYPDLWHPAHLPPDGAIQTTECKTDRLEAVSASSTPKMTKTEKSLEALQNGEVYTLENNMKCGVLMEAEFPCLEVNRASGINFLFSGVFRRELLTESVTIKDDEKTLKSMLDRDSIFQTGISLPVSQALVLAEKRVSEEGRDDEVIQQDSGDAMGLQLHQESEESFSEQVLDL